MKKTAILIFTAIIFTVFTACGKEAAYPTVAPTPTAVPAQVQLEEAKADVSPTPTVTPVPTAAPTPSPAPVTAPTVRITNIWRAGHCSIL